MIDLWLLESGLRFICICVLAVSRSLLEVVDSTREKLDQPSNITSSNSIFIAEWAMSISPTLHLMHELYRFESRTSDSDQRELSARIIHSNTSILFIYCIHNNYYY